ncbi:MAG: hypothetical protein HYU66_13270 [Armatimonadetes bacterium]|nr:hypothetical protein [Armatimonadota bacterium]
MRRLGESNWWRPALVAAFASGLSLSLAVPEAGFTYLLESTVEVAAPADRRTQPVIRPTMRLFSPADVRIDHELEPAHEGASIRRGGRVALSTYWWFRPGEPGKYRVTMESLQGEPSGLKPSRWALRLARDVPQQPRGRGAVGVGFALAAAGLLLYTLTHGAAARRTGA